MAASASHLRSRSASFIGLVLMYGLLLRSIWRIEVLRVPEEPEAFTTLLSWVPARNPAPASRAQTPPHALRGRAARAQPAPADTDQPETAITLPVVPPARVDWSKALSGAAAAALEKRQRAASQLDHIRRTPQVTEPWQESAATPAFRWYDAGAHRIDTRGPIPTLHLNDRCLLIAFVIPACLIGHIEIHGDLFEHMPGARDEAEATAAPNSPP